MKYIFLWVVVYLVMVFTAAFVDWSYLQWNMGLWSDKERLVYLVVCVFSMACDYIKATKAQKAHNNRQRLLHDLEAFQKELNQINKETKEVGKNEPN